MAIRVALNHRTDYLFDRRVSLAPHVLRLRPAAHCRTPIEAYSLRIEPAEHFINWQQDPFGNYNARLVFPEKARSLSIEVELIADLTTINPFDFFLEPDAERWPFSYDEQLSRDLHPYMEKSENGPLLNDWLAQVDRSEQPTIPFLVGLNTRLQGDVEYRIRMEPGVQACDETLRTASGSCRDSGWLLVQILRRLGLAARFVSGYLVQLAPDVKSLDGPSGPESDFTDLHAWAEVFIPGAGWIGLDPTSGLMAGEGHIPLACTPHPGSAAPVTGAMDECEVEFRFHNIVRRIHEDPRVTKPYTEEQWSQIAALGQFVDETLETGDVRLTMGGEPTFVSVDDMDSPQWTTAALGRHKRALSDELLNRLWRRFGAGGVVQFGQGKWYPGEELPRWALGCFWRKDGAPIWRNPELLATDGKESEFDVADAERFGRELATRLGVTRSHLVAGYEDAFHAILSEGNLPANVDPLECDLNDSSERRRIARILDRGLSKPVGYALPLGWDHEAKSWRSSRWTFRRGHMFLVPGDSPMGLRLPLDALPWIAPDERELSHEQSLFEPLPELGDPYGEIARRYSSLVPTYEAHPEVQPQIGTADEESEAGAAQTKILHTALCVEARDGRLHIFMPPLTHLEHYLDLVATIEASAASLNTPVRLEGYSPPADWRVQRLMVTPDPGVIEVNVQPAEKWNDLVSIVEALYDEARQCRLGTEKFMLDGRHTGTGGGNHVTLGAAKPADSPVLRRPDLLRSLVTYWQHHPGLSYLFSGMFVGPTSQAPRVDEARNESIYELEIAFAEMPEGDVPEPWLVDRLLRHLLVDLTGNTHRAEFCIDKLYSPDSPTGRLGLLEFRGFEMPPHPRMSLVQMLLLRSLIAWFWQVPYRRPLVRWGTELHDRFMLPHYIWEDLRDVTTDLSRAGFPFELEWLAPFLEFRFPLHGRVDVRDIRIELHAAVEPWPVLGEEVSRAGTARYVDSSIERLQVKVNGLTDSRHVVTCNRRRLPLRSTGTHGEYVAGVRYRAWQPPSALHPTIGVHAPLVFDLIDTWNGRSIGGCTYHVAHPGGRHYDQFPVNAYEAEGRRITRFWTYGHTPGPIAPPSGGLLPGRFYAEGNPPSSMEPPPEEVNPEYPHTLDLRRTLR